MTPLRSKITAALGVSLVLGLLMAEPADARRGGSFGSRGSRTYSQPRQTETSPGYVPPVQRSMTPPPAGGAGTQPGGASAARPGQPGYAGGAQQPGLGGSRFGGFGGGLLGGLLAGGLIGGLMGNGFGGGWGGMGAGGGLLIMLIQIAVIGLGVMLLVRLFRRRRAAGFTSGDNSQRVYGGGEQGFTGGGGFNGGPAPGGTAVPPSGPAWEIPITQQDQDDFQRLLGEIQEAFGREDYAALRERTTPEVMSYLAEELSDNATHGRRNEVSGTHLLQADVGEAWNEGDTDYATAAMRYEGIDLMRDRTSGAVLSGDPDKPSQTVEVWTFARTTGGPWKVSAIQAN